MKKLSKSIVAILVLVSLMVIGSFFANSCLAEEIEEVSEKVEEKVEVKEEKTEEKVEEKVEEKIEIEEEEVEEIEETETEETIEEETEEIAEEEVTEEITEEEETIEEEITEEETERSVSVKVRCSEELHLGDKVTLESELNGYEGCEVEYQWQVNKGEGFEDISGANGSSYSFSADEESLGYDYRVVVIAD